MKKLERVFDKYYVVFCATLVLIIVVVAFGIGFS